MNKLETNIYQFLVDVNRFFKLSTAFRENMTALREDLDMEEVTEFSHYHVTSQWSSMKPVCEKIVNPWVDLTEYVVTYLPKSTVNSHLKAVERERYLRIINVIHCQRREDSH